MHPSGCSNRIRSNNLVTETGGVLRMPFIALGATPALSVTGNATFAAAISVTKSFTVNPGSPLSDSFSGPSIDTTKWNVAISPSGSGTITQANQRVQMNTAAGVASYLGLQSKWKLSGDFDVQVDFTLLNWTPQNFHTVRLMTPDLPQGPVGLDGIYRNSYSQEGYQMRTINGVVADVSRSDTGGTMRLVVGSSN